MTCDVLVLDDDEQVLDVTVQALEDAGYAVQMAENVAAALQYLEGPGPCQVIIADINLGKQERRLNKPFGFQKLLQAMEDLIPPSG